MKIKITVLGELNNNTYFITDGDNSYLIDPATDGSELLKETRATKTKLQGVILTHMHLDHLRGITAFAGYPIYISEKDAANLTKPDTIGLMGKNFYAPGFISQNETDILTAFLKKNKLTAVRADFRFPHFQDDLKVIETPGHTEGSICIWSEKAKVLFSGDTLFAGTHGRVDLPFSNPDDMMKSLKRLSELPADTKVFPGHGSSTFIGNELDYGVLKGFSKHAT